MATASNPLDEILNSAVDESAIFALVGSLESQLASPTHKDNSHQNTSTTVNSNHVGNTSSSGIPNVGISSHTQAMQAAGHAPPMVVPSPKQGSPQTLPTVLTNSINGEKAQSPLIPVNTSVTNSLGMHNINIGLPMRSHTVSSPLLTQSHEVNIPSNSNVLTHLATGSPGPVVSVGSTNTGTVVFTTVNSICASGTRTTSVTTSGIASGGLAIPGTTLHNFTNVNPSSQPFTGAQTVVSGQFANLGTVVQQTGRSDVKPVMVNVMNNPTTNSSKQPHYVIKNEPQVSARGSPMQQLKVEPKFVTQIQSPVSSHVVGQTCVTTALKSSTVVPGTTSVIAITKTTTAATAQAVTVLRLPTSIPASTPQATQFLNMNNTNVRQTAPVNQKMLAPRVVGPQTIRVAQPVMPRQQNTVTLQPASVPSPAQGTMFVRNAQGQLVLVSSHHPMPSQQMTKVVNQHPSSQPYKLQPVKHEVRGAATSAAVTPHSHQQVTASPHGNQPVAIRPQGHLNQMGTSVRGQMNAGIRTSTANVRGVVPRSPVASAPQLAGVVQQATQPATSTTQQVLLNHQSMQENVKKCKNFLSTLIKLASSQPKSTVQNVRKLIQDLIDGSVEPERFTAQLQVELKSSPQPYLVPFLKKSLPSLRQSLSANMMKIEGVRAPPTDLLKSLVSVSQATQVSNATAFKPSPATLAMATPRATQVNQTVRPGMAPQLSNMIVRAQMGTQGSKQGAANQTRNLLSQQPVMMRPPATVGGLANANEAAGSPNNHKFKPPIGSPAAASMAQHKEKRKYDTALKDDDDINDVAAMGGVNLSEESRNIMATNSDLMAGQLRSCKDESFLHSPALQARISAICSKHGLDDAPQGVINLMSHATQELLRNLSEKLSIIAEHRLEMYKTDKRYEVSSDVKPQIKFLEELDRLEKKRHEEAEREVLLRAARSRSKNEDPEKTKLKEKAKALQQAEMEELRQQEANITALAAIGPRKKRKLDSDAQSSKAGGSAMTGGLNASTSRGVRPPRIKRVTQRDLIFLMEQERQMSKSQLLYKALLK